MTEQACGWKTRFSMIRQALSRQPKIQAMLDEAIADARADATHDGMGAAVAGMVAFEKSLRGRDDVSVDDVLDGVVLLAADLKKEKLPNVTPR